MLPGPGSASSRNSKCMGCFVAPKYVDAPNGNTPVSSVGNCVAQEFKTGPMSLGTFYNPKHVHVVHVENGLL